MRDEAPLKKVRDIIGKGSLFQNSYETRRMGKPFFNYRLSDRQLLGEILVQLLPELEVKKEKAQLILDYLKAREEFELRKVAEFEELNKLYSSSKKQEVSNG